MYTPFPYQLECLDAVEATRTRGLKRALIVMASGLGKTVTSALIVKRFREGRGGRVLFLCHNNDILYQAKATFQAVNGSECSYGYFHGEEKNLQHVDFLFASFQTMAKNQEIFRPEEFAIIVVDESHHSHADTFRPTIEYFRPEFLLGLTATPDRLDNLDIREIFGHEVYYLPLEEAMARGLVTPVDYRLLTDEIQLQGVVQASEGKRVSLAELNRKIFVPRRDEEIARLITQYSSEFAHPRVIVFCSSIYHCNQLARFLPDSFAIHSRVPEQERPIRLEMFRQGAISTVVTVDAFNEGIDVPQANVVAFLRSTSSATIFLQQLGRGLRRSEGKDKVIALDFIGNCERIQLVHGLLKKVDDALERYHPGGAGGSKVDPMTLNVNTVEFTETIVPILSLMERVRPTKVSEVERLAKEYSSKNPTPADRIAAGTNRKVLWVCSTCSYEWVATGNSRYCQETGCPACAGRVATPTNNLAAVHPEIAKEYSAKNPVPVTEITPGNNNAVLWECSKCGHEWKTKPLNRTRRGDGCPACAGRVATKTNNLVATRPELVKEYSPKNPLPADQVVAGTNKKLWWVCATCKYEWEASGANRVNKGSGCPACAGRVVTATNNLATKYPNLAAEYSPKNPLPADQVIPGTNKKLWWKCAKCGREWQATGSSRVKGAGCSLCAIKVRIGIRVPTSEEIQEEVARRNREEVDRMLGHPPSPRRGKRKART